MDKHKDLFKDLAEVLMCPSCRDVVKPPFFNLGPKFNQCEGCEGCYLKVQEPVQEVVTDQKLDGQELPPSNENN